MTAKPSGMKALGSGPFPGTSLEIAADIIASELAIKHLPELPARGLASQAIGRTWGLISELYVDRGTRRWQLQARPQRWTYLLRDQMARDLDILEQQWGGNLQRLKTQAIGPWTLALNTELSSGHRVLADPSATADLVAALYAGLAAHRAELQRRFGCPVDIYLQEPDILGLQEGGIWDTHRFDAFSPVHPEKLAETLNIFAQLNTVSDTAHSGAISTNTSAEVLGLDLSTQVQPAWDLARRAGLGDLVVNLGALLAAGSSDLDAFGQWMDEGRFLTVQIGAQPLLSARDIARGLVGLIAGLGLSREVLWQLNIMAAPGSGSIANNESSSDTRQAAKVYATAEAVVEILPDMI
ncbi:hypothetical protein [Corynebacterium caspium]|uniref:hypothetical protein n=1 Tax=Corynebacterium caspium TaxID=234828 RepID=UPI00036408D2|nr:hypothetical protein [Corynebacterium caspium]